MLDERIEIFVGYFVQKKQYLSLKFDKKDELEVPIKVRIKSRFKHQKRVDPRLDALDKYSGGQEIWHFYSKIKQAKLFSPRLFLHPPLIEFLSTSEMDKVTNYYKPNGKYAWKIDLNKSHKIYRSSDEWMVFVLIEGGDCLTIFLTGENAGSIYYLTSQPEFNILKPIAKSFGQLLARIQEDPAKFLRLVRVTVTIDKKDGFSYGFVPIQYTIGS